MKAMKYVVIAALAYVGLVVAFESMIGVFQPTAGDTLVITTYDSDGNAHDRVVSRLESGGKLYVAANHWPRAWYHRTLDRPEVGVAFEGNEGEYVVVPVSGSELEAVEKEHPLPLAFRFVTGFPPRHLLRLDPR